MSMKNVPVDVGRFTSAVCASLPQVRADRLTGEVRTDRVTGQPQFEVFVLVTVVDEREPSVINVRVPGEPTGLAIGQPVRLFDLFERKWEMDGGRSGVSYNASAITATDPTRSPTASSELGAGRSTVGKGAAA